MKKLRYILAIPVELVGCIFLGIALGCYWVADKLDSISHWIVNEEKE